MFWDNWENAVQSFLHEEFSEKELLEGKTSCWGNVKIMFIFGSKAIIF